MRLLHKNITNLNISNGNHYLVCDYEPFITGEVRQTKRAKYGYVIQVANDNYCYDSNYECEFKILKIANKWIIEFIKKD